MHIIKCNTFETPKTQIIIVLAQELQAELEELEWQNAALQEEAWQNDTLWKHATQFIEEKGLLNEYHHWVRKK